MTAGFVFPSKPKINQIFQAPNNVSYIWTGTRWELRNTVGGTPTLPPPAPSLVGPTGPTGPAGPNYLKMDNNGQINMSLIPAVGNTFSLGSSTNWWKDLWLSANTLYIGGTSISTSGGSLVIPNLNVSGTFTTTGTGLNNNDVQNPMKFLYNFNTVDNQFYMGFAGIPEAPVGQINCTADSDWPPPNANYQNDSYWMHFSLSTTDMMGNDIWPYLSKLTNDNVDWNHKPIYMIMKDGTDSSKFAIFANTIFTTFSPNNKTYQFVTKYITGTADRNYFMQLGEQVMVELEFCSTTLGGRIPINGVQKYYWKSKSYEDIGIYFLNDGYGYETTSATVVPLACNTLELHAGSSNPADLGQIILANTAEFDGRTLNVIVRGNSIAKSSFVNVSGAALSSTITANTMFTALFTTTSGQWNVTNVVTNV